MKLKDIIQRVQSLYSKGVPSDESRLTDRHIYNKLISSRNRLLTQSLNKKQSISKWNYMVLPCVKLIEVDESQCPCITPSNCTILRSSEKIPKPIYNLYNSGIQSVTSINRNIKIDEVTPNIVRYLSGNKYTKDKASYFIEGGYLYIVGYTHLTTVSIVGLFEDFVEALYFPNDCIDNNCIDILEEEFPIDSGEIDTLVEMATKELIEIFLKVREDIDNDDKDR